MAKIDLKQIENYESMSAEEKLAALEALDLPEPDYSGYVKKDLYNKASSEAAKYKKQLSDNLSEAERKEQEKAEQDAQKDEELKKLRRQVKVSEYITKYTALGYDEENAKAAANAAFDGDFEKVFELQSKHIEAVKKSVKAEAMKNTPAPNSGSESEKKMTLSEAMAYKNAHPEADIKTLI